MEIIVQTRRNFWYVSRSGFRKVPTWDWDKVKAAVGSRFAEREIATAEALDFMEVAERTYSEDMEVFFRNLSRGGKV